MKPRTQLHRLILLCLFVCFGMTTVSWAQSSRGEMAGTVKDQTGAVIVGAKIVATGVETGMTLDAVTTSAGTYRFPEIPIGRYNVTFTARGFQTVTQSGVPITINSTTPLNVTLKPGTESESVTVDASAPTVETESSDISGTISKQQIEDLPLSIATGVGGLRSPETFAFLVPGVTGAGTGGTGNNANGVFYMKVAGGQTYGAETLLDGASISRSENGSSFDETAPSIEAMQEFKVTTSVPEAEFGRTTGGVESFATRNGTNTVHGSAFLIYRNGIFDGNDWFYNGYKKLECGGSSKDCAYNRGQDTKHDEGVTFGGPVRIPQLLHPEKAYYNGRDKTFFFFAWEQYNLQKGGTAISTVPTTQQKNSYDFSDELGSATAYTNPCTGDTVYQNEIFDPNTDSYATVGSSAVPCRSGFTTTNVIPSGKISSVAKKLIATLPDPNQTPTAYTTQHPTGTGNYAYHYSNPVTDTTYTIRLDHHFSDRSLLYGTYSSRDNNRINGSPNMPLPYQNSGYLQDFTTHYERIGWDYTLTPALMNHLNVGYNRTNSTNFAPQIGNSNTLTNDGSANWHSNSFPYVYFDGYDGYNAWGVGNNGDNIDNGLRFNDSVIWQKGRHSIKLGFDYRHQQYSTILKTIPYINFMRYETKYANTSDAEADSGNAFASFMLGAVDWSSQTVYDHNSRWNSWYVGGYVQDDIKVNSNLTLNVGLRYDVDVPRKEAGNYTSNFDFTQADDVTGMPGSLVFGTTCKHCNTRWADTWMKDISPRFGFAWQVPGTNGKTVIRGGGGILYGPLLYGDFGSAMSRGYTITNYATSYYHSGEANTGANFTPAFSLDSGYDGYASSNFAANTSNSQLVGGTGVFNAVSGEVILPKFGRPAMVDSWSLQVQHEILPDLIATVGYIGQTGQNLRSGYMSNFNNMDSKYFSLGDHISNSGNYIQEGGSTTIDGTTYSAPYTSFGGYLGQSLRPYPQYDYIQGDCCLENYGHSSYQAMVASLNRKFRNGLNMQLAYTWSKTLTDADSAIAWDYISSRSQAQYSNDLRKEKAVSMQDTPHQLSISYLYKLPFGKGQKFLANNRVLDYAVGGWEVGGIQRYQSGQPIDFGCATGVSYYQNCIRFTKGQGAANGFASAAYKKNKNHPSYFNQESWFKPAYRPALMASSTDAGVSLADAAFVDLNREGRATYDTTSGEPTSQWLRSLSSDCLTGSYDCSYEANSFGSGISRVTEAITGPRYLAEDFSIMKSFQLIHNIKFVFKGEAFDAFNRHRMALPDLAPGDFPTTGTSSGFGIPTAVDYGPREMQFSGRFTF